MDFDVLVIGGGPAGVTAALRARELSAERVALIERGDRLGGTCTNDGCIPTRVLARAARLIRCRDQFEAYGIVGGGELSVDAPRLMARVHETIAAAHEKKGLTEHLAESGVRVFCGAGAARFVDPHTVEMPGRGGERLSAETILLCAGGHARRPPFPGNELAITHSGLWQMEKLPASVLVVGGAATGCQVASVMAAFGVAEVTLLEMAPRILPGEDPLVSQHVGAGLAGHGVRVLAGIDGGVERIEDRGGGLRRVFFKKGDEVSSVDAEMVVLAVGWPGNLEGLGLDAAGIETDRNYVRVDDRLRCAGSAPHVFAAGDITGRMMLVQSAIDEGRIAAENALAGADRPDTIGIVPHGGFTDPEYASVGPTEEKAREHEPDCLALTVPYSALDRALIDGRRQGAFKLLVSRRDRRVLGGHVAGEEALEVIHPVAVAMASGTTVEVLADLELAYPTFSAVLGLAARQACRELGIVPLSDRGREWLSSRPRAGEWERDCQANEGG